MAETYRNKITTLLAQLQQPNGMLEAKDALPGLIDRITLKTLKPSCKLSIHLEGALAELLLLSLDTKKEFGMVAKNQTTEYIC